MNILLMMIHILVSLLQLFITIYYEILWWETGINLLYVYSNIHKLQNEFILLTYIFNCFISIKYRNSNDLIPQRFVLPFNNVDYDTSRIREVNVMKRLMRYRPLQFTIRVKFWLKFSSFNHLCRICAQSAVTVHMIKHHGQSKNNKHESASFY